jgi:peptide/nickel transport system permease protein
MDAFAIEMITLVSVLLATYILGLMLGMILSYFSGDKLREFLLNLIHYWVSLPVLLIALFLLILIGAGQKNAIIVIILTLIPTQSLYVYNQLETVKKNDFFIAKISYGLSKSYIYAHHLYPTIKPGFISYALARMPEILMMNLALNFLGLGVQPPHSSFGRMLFDGLSFMFSAWWMWIFEIVLVIFLFLFIQRLLSKGGILDTS